MLYKPTINLTRLLVTKAGVPVFDETFHPGLNVIRGENGSGKTTVADFIFYALGGDTPQWRAEAALCDYVFAEILVNGSPVTFRRQVEQEKLRPMAIFWGNLEKAGGSHTEWHLYPYSATSKESFSQIIFHAAGIPEVKGHLAARVTLHQLLRLVYVDQKTDYDQIFRADPFDAHITREAAGDLLCGVYDDRLYEAEIDLREKDAKRAALQSELKTIFSLMGEDTIPNLDFLGQQKTVSISQRKATYDELSKLRTREAPQPVDELTSRRATVAKELAEQNELVRDLQDRIKQTQVDMADRQQFLMALRRRLSALAESEGVHDTLGAFAFKFCPACYAPLTAPDGACHLCKTPTETRRGQNLLRLKSALEQQIRESESLQKNLSSLMERQTSELSPAIDRQRKLQLQFEELSKNASAAVDAAAAELHRRIGYLDRTIEDLDQRSRLAARVTMISERQAELAAEISRLSDEVAARRVGQEQTKRDAYSLISNLAVEILKGDLPREGAFLHALDVHFDFGMNRVSVDGRSTFAASSNVYLKNALHLALLKASTLRDYIRYPRLAIMDNVEDKGMEPERSHNFQRIVREFSETTEVDHQIILFTSMMAPEFEKEPRLLVGPYYTHESKTLRVAPVGGTTLQLE